LAKKKRYVCFLSHIALAYTKKAIYERKKNLQEDNQGMNGKGCTKCGNLIHGQHQMLGVDYTLKKPMGPPYAGPWVHPDPKTVNREGSRMGGGPTHRLTRGGTRSHVTYAGINSASFERHDSFR